jgi:AraC-like DNA-binding protein
MSYVTSQLVFFVQLARIATRAHVVPLEVISPVSLEPEDEYTEYFGVAVKKGDGAVIVFSAEDAARPFLTANEKMWEFFEPELRKRLSQLDESATTTDRVHAVLLELLPGGAATVDSVAQKLGTSTRTLQRQLKDEGENFQVILNRTREDLAKHYLKSSNLTGSEISFLLGFNDPNSFSRAFHVWTGTTPEQARSTLREII